MKTRIGIVIILIEIASIAALLWFLNLGGMPEGFGRSLVFLLPIAFGLHVCEEFIFPGGAIQWFKQYHPEYAQAYTESYFFKVNAIPLALSLLVAFGTFDFAGGFSFFGIRAWLAFLSFLTINTIFHVRAVLETRKYSPGVGTSVLAYLPLAVFSLIYLLQTGAVDIFSAIVCISVGSCIQPVLDYIKKRNMVQHQYIR